jgi:hypothetical protein
MATNRPQWPHTVDDIYRSLDGIWGLVGATATNGNLMRLEKSLYEPLSFTVTEYESLDERKILRKTEYTGQQKNDAVRDFAIALGFNQADLDLAKNPIA